eukprot:5914615-Prymnesium_polylepis.1
MLLCDRNPTAYAPLALVEGVHAAMFNSIEEFAAKARYYLAHDDERRALVRAARRLVVERHEWVKRGAELANRVRVSLPEFRRRQHREKRQGPPALPQVVEKSAGGEVYLVERNRSEHRGGRGPR